MPPAHKALATYRRIAHARKVRRQQTQHWTPQRRRRRRQSQQRRRRTQQQQQRQRQQQRQKPPRLRRPTQRPERHAMPCPLVVPWPQRRVQQAKPQRPAASECARPGQRQGCLATKVQAQRAAAAAEVATAAMTATTQAPSAAALAPHSVAPATAAAGPGSPRPKTEQRALLAQPSPVAQRLRGAHQLARLQAVQQPRCAAQIHSTAPSAMRTSARKPER